MSQENITNFHNSSQVILDVANCLQSLSYAFDRTGNKKVSVELYDLLSELKESHKKMNDAFTGNLHESFKSAQENSGLLLKAVLAGAALATKE